MDPAPPPQHPLHPFSNYDIQGAFVEEIRMEPHPMSLREFKFATYSGQSNPADHVNSIQDVLTIYPTTDPTRCKLFLTTLRGEARHWFSSLAPRSIYSYGQLVQAFLEHFSNPKEPEKHTDDLLTIRQGPNESLRSYIKRFLEEMATVPELVPEIAILAIRMGLQKGFFKHNLSLDPPPTLGALLDRAKNYIHAEEEEAVTYTSMDTPRVQQYWLTAGSNSGKGSNEEEPNYFENLGASDSEESVNG